MTHGTMSALHSSCPNSPCLGAQCNRTRPYVNSMAPRTKTRPTKAERHLTARINAFEAPNSKTVSGQEHHRPGSQNRNS